MGRFPLRRPRHRYMLCWINMEMGSSLHISLRFQRGGIRHKSATTTAYGAHGVLTKNHMNAYDYEHGSNWTPAWKNIQPALTGCMQWNTHMNVSHSLVGLNPVRTTPRVELDPDETHLPAPRRIITVGPRPHWTICQNSEKSWISSVT